MRSLRVMLGGLVLTGCVVSVDAVVPESVATYDARLVGHWAEVDGKDRAVVTRDSNRYAIAYTDDKGKVGQFEAYLGRVGTKLVLDVMPGERESDPALPEAWILIRGHALFAIEIAADSASIAILRQDSVGAALARGALRLSYHIDHDQVALTGTTAELRRGLAAYVERQGVFDSPSRWRRVDRQAPAARAPQGSALAAAVPRATCFTPAPWPEADAMFRRDRHWVGADGASSVALGGGRILWLFGDTWIDPSGSRTRRGAQMVSNTVAIQRGTDPRLATVTFYWGNGPDGKPAAIFPDRRGERLWLGNGVRVGDRLVLFLNRVTSVSYGLGFQSVGWTAFSVSNPDAEPSEWIVTELATQPNPLGVIVGYAAVLRLGDYLYAFGSEDPVKSHPIYAVRWPAAAVQQGSLANPEWWGGQLFGWVPDSTAAARVPLFENGSSDLTIHFDAPSSRFLAVQSVGFGPADIMTRTAPALTGPWTQPQWLYRPPEYARPNVMLYSAKAHPELTGADMVLTYVDNSFQFADHLKDSTTYYPHFVRFTRC